MIDFNRHIEIERYINGEMSLNEKQAFEQKLNEDKKLKEEFEFQALANGFIKAAHKNELRHELQNIHQRTLLKKWLKAFILIVSIMVSIGALSFLLSKRNHSKTSVSIKKETASQKDFSSMDTTVNSSSTNSITLNAKKSKLDSNSTHNVPKMVLDKVNDSDQMNNHKENKDSIFYESNDLVAIEKPILKVEKNPTLEIPLDSVDSIKPNLKTDSIDPCLHAKNKKLSIDVEEPCLGSALASVQFFNPKNNWVKWKYEETDEEYDIGETIKLPIGNYAFMAKNANGCWSESTLVNIQYKVCHHLLRPKWNEFLELDLDMFSEPMMFKVLDAKTGIVSYQERILDNNRFIYQATAQNGQLLPMGDYVFILTSDAGKFIGKGQITVIY